MFNLATGTLVVIPQASRWLDENKADLAVMLAAEGETACLLELAQQLGHVGHWRVRLPDYTITWSTEVYRIHGVSPDHYKPDIETAIGFYHPDDRDIVTAAVALAARDGTPFEFSLRLIRPNGELRHVESRGLVITGPDNVPAQIFGVFIDITEQRKAEDLLHEANRRLSQIAYVDALTLLANRRQFDDVLDREWRRAIREQTGLSLIMLDIDRFKNFNDLYGHLAGDDCLRTVAAAVAAIVQRPGDLVARYGGEEFVLILPGTEASGALRVAHAVHAAVAALGLTHAGNPSCGGVVTASLGVATVYPQAGTPSTSSSKWSSDWLSLMVRVELRRQAVVSSQSGFA